MSARKCDVTTYFLQPVGEDDEEIEIPVRIQFNFRPGCKDYYDRALGGWLPGDPPEIEFLDAFVTVGKKEVALPATDMLRSWAEKWLDQHPDEATQAALEDVRDGCCY